MSFDGKSQAPMHIQVKALSRLLATDYIAIQSLSGDVTDTLRIVYSLRSQTLSYMGEFHACLNAIKIFLACVYP